MEQVAQGNCDVSILRDMQNHVRNSPGRPDLVDSALIGMVGAETPRDPSHPHLSCDPLMFDQGVIGATEGKQVYL